MLSFVCSECMPFARLAVCHSTSNRELPTHDRIPHASDELGTSASISLVDYWSRAKSCSNARGAAFVSGTAKLLPHTVLPRNCLMCPTPWCPCVPEAVGLRQVAHELAQALYSTQHTHIDARVPLKTLQVASSGRRERSDSNPSWQPTAVWAMTHPACNHACRPFTAGKAHSGTAVCWWHAMLARPLQ
jgi:hypothetical protein